LIPRNKDPECRLLLVALYKLALVSWHTGVGPSAQSFVG